MAEVSDKGGLTDRGERGARVDGVDHLFAQADELGLRLDLRAGAGHELAAEVQPRSGGRRGRARRHHDQPVARNRASSTSWVMKKTSFVRGPDLQHQLLRLLAGERVQRAEGLVHQQHGRVGRQRAGNAHRCCCPPESW
jgi:hypothetical protein